MKWIASLYLQPFLQVAGGVAAHAVISNVVATPAGIEMTAGGGVSSTNQTIHGTWSSALDFSYNPTNKEIVGSGSYVITLPGPLGGAMGDLNLYKLASNLLTNVPVLSGGMTNTGDMSQVLINGSNGVGPIVLHWDPPAQPAHCPTDNFDRLSVSVIGDDNEVDTAAQGHCPIQAAYKPTMTVDLTSHHPGLPLRFCGFWDTTKAQDFAADNIGINAILAQPITVTNYEFDVAFRSTVLPQDGVGVDATVTATFPTSDTEIAVYYTPSLDQPFSRLVGSLPRISTNTYRGTVGVPFPPHGPSPTQGCFRVNVSCRQ